MLEPFAVEPLDLIGFLPKHRCFPPSGLIIPSTLQKSLDCKYYTNVNSSGVVPANKKIFSKSCIDTDCIFNYLEHTTDLWDVLYD